MTGQPGIASPVAVGGRMQTALEPKHYPAAFRIYSQETAELVRDKHLDEVTA